MNLHFRLSGQRRFASLLFIVLAIFTMDLLVEVVLAALPRLPQASVIEIVADPVLTLLLLTPLAWWLVVTPLHRAAVESQSMLQVSMDGMWITDMQGRFLMVNDAYCLMIGYTRDELLAMRIGDIEAVESAEATAAHIASVMRAGSDRFVTRHRRKDGAVLDIEVSVSYAPLNGGRLFVVARDMTQRKQLHDALRESETRYRTLAQSAHDAIITADSAGDIVGWNRGAASMFGYAEAEVTGQPLTLLIPQRHCEPHLAGMHRFRSGESRVVGKTIETEGQRKDASEFPLELSLTKWESLQGTFVTGIIRDITERKRAEATLSESELRYRHLFEAHPLSMWVYDLETLAFLEVNDAAVAQYGYGRDEFLAMTVADIRPAEDVGRLLADIEHIDNDAMDLGSSWRHRKKDGSIIDVDIRAHSITHRGRRARLVLAQDITSRKRAEDDLRHSIELLNQTGLIAAVGGWELDVDLQRLHWTKETYRIHEVDSAVQPSLAEAIGFYAPEARPVITAAVQAAIDAGTPFDVELPFVTAKGTRLWVRAQGVAERREGRTIRIYGAFQDITERKVATETLVAKEAHVRAIMNNVPYLMWLKDRDGRFLTVNDLFARSCGRETAQEVIGKTDLDVWPADLANKYRADDAEVMATRMQKKTEEPIAEPDGVKWFETFKTSIRDAKGEVIGTTGVSQNITERRVAEESRRLQSAALQATADAIVITDRTGAIEWVNPAFVELTGYTAEEALGKNSRDLVKSGKHAPEFFKELWETINAGRVWRGDTTNRRKDGRLYTERQTITPILDASGAITHFVAIKKDVTERLQLEAQFRQAQKMEGVGQLASGIAHDFNNLLTVINGTAELMLAQVGHDDPVHADALEIHRAGERAATLTGQLLAFSRQQILEPRVLNVNTVVAEMESLLRRLLGENVNLVVSAAPDLSSVMADPGQLGQVLTNLAVNARDAMPQGGRLTIATENVVVNDDDVSQHSERMPAGSYVRLTVSDSGVGMDEDTRMRIFEPFFTTKGPGHGTGLGLSTVYGIVKQSHGFIGVYSEAGHGTSFTIYLPQVHGARSADKPAPALAPSVGTETILLVEDNAGLRKLATRILEPAGYTVLAAATGEEALRVLEHHAEPVHLLISDVVLPGISGRLVAEQLARIRPATKVLYMSGYTSDTIVRHGVLDAQVPFLSKPFPAAALLRKVREVLDS